MEQNNQSDPQSAAPVSPEYEAPVYEYGQPASAAQQPQAEPYVVLYPHSSNDVTLLKVAFAFQIVNTVLCCWMIIPLAWMIPMCVIGYKMMNGQKANTVAWGVCNLIFVSVISGILYLVASKDEKRY